MLDTHLLLWAAAAPENLPLEARAFIENESNVLMFSVASIWEVAIKRALNRSDFDAEPEILRKWLLQEGFDELPILGNHAIEVRKLPRLHSDPFDRILVAQAILEDVTLLTSDAALVRYAAPVRLLQ